MPTQTDPKQRSEKPPFQEPRQSPPGHESEMRTKPDHGEQSYRGSDRLRGLAAYAREGADVAISYLPEEAEDAKNSSYVTGSVLDLTGGRKLP